MPLGAGAVRPECTAHAVYLALAANLLGMVLLSALIGFRYDGSTINGAIFFIVLALALAALLRRAELSRLGSALETIALFGAFSICAPLLATLLASTSLPLADPLLARLDRLLFFGFDRTHFVEKIDHLPNVMATTQIVYHSLIVQPPLLLAFLAALRPGRAWTLLLGWALALAITVSVFPFYPALGTPPYFLDFMDTFNGARDGSLRILGKDALTGIITFPSFHAAAAVLLAWGFAGLGRPGLPFVILNVLMFWSALIAGHYLIDLVAGGLVAWASIRLASRVTDACAPRSGDVLGEHGQPALVHLRKAAGQL